MSIRFDCLTLFPHMFEAVLGDSIIGRAREKNIIELNFYNIRDFSEDKHKRVDDYPYGGGNGMLMQPMPIYNAYKHIIGGLDYKPKVIYMSPQGKVFNQAKALQLAKQNHIVLLSGHYEGIDERIIEEIVDEEISIGDFVLTGGEIPSMALIDSICRLIPGVLSNNESFEDESLYNNLLEYPQYTRPYKFLDKEVPKVLISGHHKNISKWRREQSIKRTYEKRPELLKNADLTKSDIEYLNKIKK